MKFYFKLAFSNIRTNKAIFAPYILSAMGTVLIYYNLSALMSSVWDKMGTTYAVLGLASAVTALLAIAFMYYTHSFLMRRRRKEFGLYNILGMEKKHITRLMLHENLIVYLIISVAGIGVGILLNGLFTLLLFNLIGEQPQYSFNVDIEAVLRTLILIGAIFVITLINSAVQVKRAKPVDLMKSEGEREPKARVAMTIIGCLLLGSGYFLANHEFIMGDLIIRLFGAIIIVAVATYVLFITGSVALLKVLKRNKNYYYKKRNFLTTSSMMYRMRKNAVGLANICIMSTALIMVLSSTLSLYVGLDKAVDDNFPRNTVVTINFEENPNHEDEENYVRDILGYMDENEILYSNTVQSPYVLAYVNNHEGQIDDLELGENNNTMLIILSESDYNALAQTPIDLGENEMAVTLPQITSMIVAGKTVSTAQIIDTVPIADSVMFMDEYFSHVVLEDDMVHEFLQNYSIKYEKYAFLFDAEGLSDAHKEELMQYIYMHSEEISGGNNVNLLYRSTFEAGSFEIYGGLFFIGLLLGMLFLMGTVLVMYYKQVAEGMEDKERFRILVNIGLSKKEVKAVIRSQILRVFFLPIVVAFIHTAFAYAAVSMFVSSFIFQQSPPILECTLVTGGVFLAAYIIAYMATSRVYYKIVGEK